MGAVDVIAIETTNLGDRSYVIGSQGAAVVIDPQRDIDRVRGVLDERGWTASHVLETHFHNDYVSGGLELARVLGAEYVVPDGMAIDFEARQIRDNDGIACGIGALRVLHTPGHTQGSTCLWIPAENKLVAGDTLFRQSIGRTDLPGGDFRQILYSIHSKLLVLPDDAVVVPGHGPNTTIGYERDFNPFL